MTHPIGTFWDSVAGTLRDGWEGTVTVNEDDRLIVATVQASTRTTLVGMGTTRQQAMDDLKHEIWLFYSLG